MTKYLLILLLISCNTNKFDVRSAQTNLQNKNIILGEINKRDYQLSNNIALDIRDLLRFELISKGYNVELLDTNYISDEIQNEISSDNEIGQLPLALRESAGELFKPKNKTNTTKVPEEVSKLIGPNNFNFYLKGSISRYENQIILEPENNFLIIIDIYDNYGKHKGIATASVQVKENKHTEELKEATNNIINEIKIKILDSK